jgi:NADH dehydrogenase [ubiquinone] 1 alpha subcomplex assembly factor 7
MRQCLTSDLGGYYTNTTPSSTPSHDQFGTKGDFVTSPEISQVFGELIGIWIVAEWIAQGRKSEGVVLMELGPGRGTLMDDVLRTIRNFPPLAKALEAVYMVEAGAGLREKQHRLLCGENESKETEIGWESTSKHNPSLKIIWTDHLRFVPRNANQTPFMLAHEFFDALPIHVFQSVPPDPNAPFNNSTHTIQTPTGPVQRPTQQQAKSGNQWRELVVSPKAPHRLKSSEPEFELSASKTPTPHAIYLPETSSRYKALKPIDGATIEISPESQAITRELAILIGGSNPPTAPSPTTIPSRNGSEPPFLKPTPSGAALIIDYGPPDHIPANTLRGIKAHKLVSPFHSPGTTDVSADVDFLALAEAALNGSPGIEVHGPVDQARFLRGMGIEERARQLIERARRSGNEDEVKEVVERIESGWKRLVDVSPQGMGRLYYVMAIVPYTPAKEGEVRRRPVGFGGDVVL